MSEEDEDVKAAAVKPVSPAEQLSKIFTGTTTREALMNYAESLKLSEDVRNRMGQVSKAYGGTLGSLAEHIARQTEAIKSARLSFHPDAAAPNIEAFQRKVDDLRPLPPPARMTNDILRDMSDKFDKVHDVALNAAEIANSLHSVVVELLAQFKTEAGKAEKAGRYTFWTSAIAAGLAVFGVLVQIGYTEFRRVPADSAFMQNALATVTQELAESRQEQAEMLERLSTAITSGDHELAQALTELAGPLVILTEREALRERERLSEQQQLKSR